MKDSNGTEFNILNILTNEKVGTHFQVAMRITHWDDLLIYEPLDEHVIQPWGYYADNEYWEGDKMNLKGFYDMITDRTESNIWDNPEMLDDLDDEEYSDPRCIIPIQEFVDACLTGLYIDYDGYGEIIVDNINGDTIYPSEVNAYGWEAPTGVTHVQWYNTRGIM